MGAAGLPLLLLRWQWWLVEVSTRPVVARIGGGGGMAPDLTRGTCRSVVRVGGGGGSACQLDLVCSHGRRGLGHRTGVAAASVVAGGAGSSSARPSTSPHGSTCCSISQSSPPPHIIPLSALPQTIRLPRLNTSTHRDASANIAGFFSSLLRSAETLGRPICSPEVRR
ncbi:hypothetical protein ZWY2020_026986 [Hordeum vulgare]|nr:hypothetical protein ZWY2020_026986 [Hordeum vulgare]